MGRAARLGCVMVLCLCSGCAKPTAEPMPTPPVVAPDDGAMRLRTRDGALVYGRRVKPLGQSKPLKVLLVHMLGRTHSDWDAFAAKLAEHGYDSLAIDLRGHGRSTAPEGAELTYRQFTPAQWQAAANDLVAARAAMTPGPIAEIGASIGANLALVDAAAHPEGVVGVAALSPGLEFRGVTTESAVAELKLPVFLAACEGDAYSFDSIDKLAAEDPGVTLYHGLGKSHGTEMLGVAEGLEAQLLEWLDGLVD